MKVSGGLVGITLNEAARTKLFLIAPELARLAHEEAKEIAGVSADNKERHHGLSVVVMQQEEKDVSKMTAAVRNFTNPFADGAYDLFNIVTKVVMPENVAQDLLQQKAIGRKLLQTFVDERIKTTKVNLWSAIKKRKLLTWKHSSMKANKDGDKVIELKEDRSLFARMMLVCRNRPEIDIEEAVGLYEFSVDLSLLQMVLCCLAQLRAM